MHQNVPTPQLKVHSGIHQAGQDIPAGPRRGSRKYFTIKYTAGRRRGEERAYKIHLFCNLNRIFI